MCSKYQSIVSIDVWTQIFTVVNILFLYFFLKKYFFGAVKGIIRARNEEILKIYKDAADLKSQALDLQLKYETKIKCADDEALKIISSAKMEAHKECVAMIKNAELFAEKILEESRSKANREKEFFVSDLKKEMVKIILLITSDILGDDINDVKNEKLIKSYIERVKI